VFADQLAHERRHGVGIQRLTPPAGEDQTAAISPGRCRSQPFFALMTLVLTQDNDSLAVDADDSGPAAFGCSLDSLALHHGGRSGEGDLSRVEIDRSPAEVEQLAAPGAGIGRKTVEGV
jgi:hypothetical protein